jgi:SWI/SNF-related matrix-associated actin-dependent regulator 1 of chromatin subfamily A
VDAAAAAAKAEAEAEAAEDAAAAAAAEEEEEAAAAAEAAGLEAAAAHAAEAVAAAAAAEAAAAAAEVEAAGAAGAGTELSAAAAAEAAFTSLRAEIQSRRLDRIAFTKRIERTAAAAKAAAEVAGAAGAAEEAATAADGTGPDADVIAAVSAAVKGHFIRIKVKRKAPTQSNYACGAVTAASRSRPDGAGNTEWMVNVDLGAGITKCFAVQYISNVEIEKNEVGLSE